MDASEVWIGAVPYTAGLRQWMNAGGHYLNNAPPGCLYAVAVMHATDGLFDEPVGDGVVRGLCIVGRPVARALPQDGSVGEVTRLYLEPGLPYGTASAVLRAAGQIGRERGMQRLISYHDRTRHTGCIYKKAGFKRDGVVANAGKGWASRNRSQSAIQAAVTPKRRWKLELTKETPDAAVRVH